MELIQLEMLVAVAEERSFLRAAERVFRTQPAVSIGLRKLEAKVGVPLLDRSSRRSACLTPAGARLYEYARKILGLRDEALSVSQQDDETSLRTLRVGIVGEENLMRFPPLWKRFKDGHPGVELKLWSDGLNGVLGEISKGHLDVALVAGRPRCEARTKNLIVTRLRLRPPHTWLWVVRQKFGQTPLAQAFEKCAVENVSTRQGRPERKKLELRRVRISARAKAR